ELTLLWVGAQARERPLRIGHAEEVEDERERLPEAVVEQHERARDLAACRRRIVPLRDVEVRAEELQDGEERQRAAVREAVRLVDGNAAGSPPLHQLQAETALADPGLAPPAADLRLPPHPPLEGRPD